MMATANETLGASAPGQSTFTRSFTQFVDRWIYVIMAAWFVITALIGFVPSSIGKVMAVQMGVRPPLPAVLHVHAVLMGSWLLLLLAQATLMATGRRTAHMQLGIASVVLVPAIVITGLILVPTSLHANWEPMRTAPPEFLPGGSFEAATKFISSVVAAQIMSGLLFPFFVGWALLSRRRDAGMHKRLMILATAVPLPAAIDRIGWLPTTYPESAVSPMVYAVVWILPMLLWDLVRLRTLHRAYVVWFAVFVPAATVVNLVWWKPWWVAFVQRVLGLG
jgi:hypothetical protein